jgi:hypothetical protein
MLDGGEVDQALMYFFSRQNRNLKVPTKYQMQQTLVQKLDLLTWCLKVPHPEIVIEEKMQNSEDEVDGDVEEGDLAQIWPEAEEELRRLKIITPEQEKTVTELEKETERAFEELNDDKSAHKRAKKKSKHAAAESQKPAGSPDTDVFNPRDVRTRSGRVRQNVTRLSYNHKDPNSVAMLYYSNQ